jgi:copper chaperone CopZ
MIRIFLTGMLLWSLPLFAQIKSATLIASGLTCSMCSKSIFKALEKVPSIKSVDADVEKSEFAIQFKEGSDVSIDEVKNAVEGAGFSVASLIFTATLSNVSVQNDAHLEIGGNTFHFLNVPKKNMNGDVAIKVVDKNFLSAKEHKKFGKYTKMKCFETGMRSDCCPAGASSSKRVYHVTI